MTELIVYILATWRLARLLAVPVNSDGEPIPEDGPYGVLDRLRHLAGVRYDDLGNVYGANELARGLICVFCNSVWIGLVVALGWLLIPDVMFWLALPLALSGGAVLVNEIIER